MPTDTIGWLWWFFTAVVLATIVGIGINLITPRVKEIGESWFQARRLKKQKYRESLEKLSVTLDREAATVFLFFTVRFMNYGLLFFAGFGVLGIGIMVITFPIFVLKNPQVIVLQISIIIAISLAAVGFFISMRALWKTFSTATQIVDLWRVHSERKDSEGEYSF